MVARAALLRAALIPSTSRVLPWKRLKSRVRIMLAVASCSLCRLRLPRVAGLDPRRGRLSPPWPSICTCRRARCVLLCCAVSVRARGCCQVRLRDHPRTRSRPSLPFKHPSSSRPLVSTKRLRFQLNPPSPKQLAHTLNKRDDPSADNLARPRVKLFLRSGNEPADRRSAL